MRKKEEQGCEDGEWQETQEEASGSGLQMAVLVLSVPQASVSLT